jgi:hypothetical protein
MTNRILLKRSDVANTAPNPGDLEYGELAINYEDGKVFYKTSADEVAVLVDTQNIDIPGDVTANAFIGDGSQLTGVTALAAPAGSNTEIQFNDSGNLSASANLTWDGINLQVVGSANITGILGVSGNATAGNIITAGQVVAMGNVQGNYFIGNGSQLTGITAGGTPGGSSGQVQFNNAGSFGGSANFTFDGTNVTVVGNISAANVSGSASNVTVTAGSFSWTFDNTGTIRKSSANGVGNIGSSTSYFNTVFAKATSAQYADLAEIYSADADYEPGTAVCFGGDHEVTQSTQRHCTRVAGVVSTNPSYLMNAGYQTQHPVAVALQGRVPARVQGPVSKGDRLVTGSQPGTLQVLDVAHYQPGVIVGKALEDNPNTDTRIIEVAVGRL